MSDQCNEREISGGDGSEPADAGDASAAAVRAADADDVKEDSTTQPKKKQRQQCTALDFTKQDVGEGFCMRHGGKRAKCKVEGCNNYRHTGGLCGRHRPKRPKCCVEGCPNQSSKSCNAAKGDMLLCPTHAEAKECKVEDCSNLANRRGVCMQHGHLCSAKGCTNSRIPKGGICKVHYGNIIKLRKCSAEGCSNNSRKGGKCVRHGAKVARKICVLEGCAKVVKKGGVCSRHYTELPDSSFCIIGGCNEEVDEGMKVCILHIPPSTSRLVVWPSGT